MAGDINFCTFDLISEIAAGVNEDITSIDQQPFFQGYQATTLLTTYNL